MAEDVVRLYGFSPTPPPEVWEPGFNRREAPRDMIRTTVRWDHRRLEDQPGELRDISETGLFFRPACGTVRFRPDDVVWGTLMIGTKPRVFAGVVRWRGWSIEHRCVGLGVSLEPTSQLTEAELIALRFPVDPAGRPTLSVLRGRGLERD
jgi:hypothetical protein